MPGRHSAVALQTGLSTTVATKQNPVRWRSAYFRGFLGFPENALRISPSPPVAEEGSQARTPGLEPPERREPRRFEAEVDSRTDLDVGAGGGGRDQSASRLRSIA
jgi:hypothetical protein